MGIEVITRSDLAPLQGAEVISPVITDYYRSYGNYAEYLTRLPDNVAAIDKAPAYVYLTGSGGIEGYNVDDVLLSGNEDIVYNIAVVILHSVILVKSSPMT